MRTLVAAFGGRQFGDGEYIERADEIHHASSQFVAPIVGYCYCRHVVFLNITLALFFNCVGWNQKILGWLLAGYDGEGHLVVGFGELAAGVRRKNG